MKHPRHAILLLLLTIACGEPVRPAAPRATLPFTPRPGTAEVGEAFVVQIEARVGRRGVRREYTDRVAAVREGRAVQVERKGVGPLRWHEGRFVDEQGKRALSFEAFEQLLPPRDGEDIPMVWSRDGVLASLHDLLGEAWDEKGGTARCEFEEILVHQGSSEAWVAVHYRDRLRTLTGRLRFDLDQRMLTHVHLSGDRFELTATRRVTTVN